MIGYQRKDASPHPKQHSRQARAREKAGQWTEEQDAKLRELHAATPHDWATIRTGLNRRYCGHLASMKSLKARCRELSLGQGPAPFIVAADRIEAL